MFERLRILGPLPAGNLRASAAQIKAFDHGTWRYKVVLAERPAGSGDSVGGS